MTKVTLVKPMLGEIFPVDATEIKTGIKNEDAKMPAVSAQVIEVKPAVAVIAKEETAMNEMPANEPVVNEQAAVASEQVQAKAKTKSARPKVGRPASQKAAAPKATPKAIKTPRKKPEDAKEAVIAIVTQENVLQPEAVKQPELQPAGPKPAAKMEPKLKSGSISSELPTLPATHKDTTVGIKPAAGRVEVKPDKTGIADRIQINQLQKELARIELAKDLAEDAKVRQMDLKFTVFVVVLFVGVMLGLAALINNHKTQTVVVAAQEATTQQAKSTEPKTVLEPLDKPAQSDASTAAHPSQADTAIIQPAPVTINQPALEPSTAITAGASAKASSVPTAVTPVASTSLAPPAGASQAAAPAAPATAPVAAAQDRAAQSENLLSILNRE